MQGSPADLTDVAVLYERAADKIEYGITRDILFVSCTKMKIYPPGGWEVLWLWEN